MDLTVLSLIVNRYTKVHVHVTCDKPTLIITHSTRCRTMVGFTPHVPYPQGQTPVSAEAGWVGPRASLDNLKRKISSPCQESNKDFSVVQPMDYVLHHLCEYY